MRKEIDSGWITKCLTPSVCSWDPVRSIIWCLRSDSAPPLPSCVALGILLNLACLTFLICKMHVIANLPPRLVWGFNDIIKHWEQCLVHWKHCMFAIIIHPFLYSFIHACINSPTNLFIPALYASIQRSNWTSDEVRLKMNYKSQGWIWETKSYPRSLGKVPKPLLCAGNILQTFNHRPLLMWFSLLGCFSPTCFLRKLLLILQG